MRIIIAFFGAVMGGGVARIYLDIVGSRGEGAASGLFTPAEDSTAESSDTAAIPTSRSTKRSVYAPGDYSNK